MKKTVSLAAAALLALTLGACDSEKSDKPDPQPTTSAETTEATSSEEETTAEETTSEEETSEDPTNSADGDLPTMCQNMLSGLKVGDQVSFTTLTECVRAASESMTSARAHTEMGSGDFKLTMEGTYQKVGDQTNFDMSSDVLKVRKIGDKAWADEGTGWRVLDPNDPHDKQLLDTMDPDAMLRESTDILSAMGELTVKELSADKYVFTLEDANGQMDGLVTEFTYNGKFWNTGMVFSMEGLEMRMVTSNFNEPVDIQPPM